MIKESRHLLVRELRSDTTLFSLVSGRIYPQDLATLSNPTYPSVTISLNGGIPDDYNQDLAEANVVIQSYSTKSYNQCWDIFEKVKSALVFGIFTDASVRIRMTESSTPIERYDQIGRVYIVTSSWNMMTIGV